MYKYIVPQCESKKVLKISGAQREKSKHSFNCVLIKCTFC